VPEIRLRGVEFPDEGLARLSLPGPSGVEDRVLRGRSLRTPPGPEGSNGKKILLGAAGAPGWSRLAKVSQARKFDVGCTTTSWNSVEIKHSPWNPTSRRLNLPPLLVWRWLKVQAPQGLAAFIMMLVLVATLAWGYLQSLATVRIIVDGTALTLHTNQTSVASVLRDAGVTTWPQDRVIPPLDTPIEDGDAIRVDHARPVVVNVDGQTLQTRSLKSSPVDIVTDLGLALSPYDKLIVDGQPAASVGRPVEAASSSAGRLMAASLSSRSPRETGLPVPRSITVQRAMTLSVRTNGTASVTLHTTAPTVGEALREAGMTLYLADKVSPDLSTLLGDGQAVNIEPAVPVTILADGRHLHTRTHRKTVSEALAEVGVPLMGLDYTDPAPNAPLKSDMSIRVVRVAETFRIEQEPIPFEINWLPDPEMEIDTRALKQTGENGVLQKRIRVRTEDGKEVSRQLDDSGVIREPKNKIISYGQKIVIRTLDTPNGPVEYWRRIKMLATSYSASTAGTPKSAPYYGRTRLGWQMRFGIVAVDPAVVRLGSQVYVANYGIGDAGDTGSAIKGKRIDLGFDDDDPRVWQWYRWTDVYLLTPVPDNFSYVIPDWPPEP